jgi:hypothetical protein
MSALSRMRALRIIVAAHLPLPTMSSSRRQISATTGASAFTKSKPPRPSEAGSTNNCTADELSACAAVSVAGSDGRVSGGKRCTHSPSARSRQHIHPRQVTEKGFGK